MTNFRSAFKSLINPSQEEPSLGPILGASLLGNFLGVVYLVLTGPFTQSRNTASKTKNSFDAHNSHLSSSTFFTDSTKNPRQQTSEQQNFHAINQNMVKISIINSNLFGPATSAVLASD